MSKSKKNKFLVIAIFFLIGAIVAFYLSLLAVRRPSVLGENPPSETIFFVIIFFCLTMSGTYFGKMWSSKDE